MTDHGEREVRKWARRRNGEPLTPHDVVDLVFAMDEDHENDHKESMAHISRLEERISAHFIEATARDVRIAAAEQAVKVVAERQLDWEEGCPAREEAIHAEHLEFHERHLATDHPPRRADDDPDTDYRDRRKEPSWTKAQIVANFWTIVAIVGVNAGITFLVVYLLEQITGK